MAKQYVRAAKWTFIPGIVLGGIILFAGAAMPTRQDMLVTGAVGLIIFLASFLLWWKTPAHEVIDDGESALSVGNRLSELEDLKESGLINEDEYRSKRKQILDDL